MASMKLVINGQAYNVDASPDATLLSVLREQLDLTGSKYGCGEGQCGACTVLVDGRARRSCQMRRPPMKALRLSPRRTPGGSFFRRAALPPPSTT